MFYSLINRIRTVGGMGAWHGHRNHPAHAEGIAIPLWGHIGAPHGDVVLDQSDNVTPIALAGGRTNG